MEGKYNSHYSFERIVGGYYNRCYFFKCVVEGGTFEDCFFDSSVKKDDGDVTVINNYETKHCASCDQHKPVECFSKNNKASDGLQAKCKDCFKSYYSTNKNTMQQQQAEYKKNNPRDEEKINVSTVLQRILNGTSTHLSFTVTGTDWITLHEWLEFTGKMYTGIDGSYQQQKEGCVLERLYPLSHFSNPRDANMWMNLRRTMGRLQGCSREPTREEVANQMALVRLFLDMKGFARKE